MSIIRAMEDRNIDKAIAYARRRMTEAARSMEFVEAAQWRDELLRLEQEKGE